MNAAARRAGLVHAGMFVLYLVVSAIYTRPLVEQSHLRIANDPGDPVLNASILWWNATTVPFSSAWWTPPHFYPAEGVSAFTENLVGVSLVSAPAFWMSGNPLLAYNVALFATWPLSAMAAYLLTFFLVRRHDAAFVAGLAFAFAPYRVTQLAHIQVLSAYWFPMALLGLHGYVADRRWRWLFLFGAAWVLQSLSNGYFMLFGSVIIALWLLYFCSSRATRRALPGILFTWALASLPLLAVFLTYRSVHQRYGLGRSVGDAIGYSAEPWAWTQVSRLVWFWYPTLGDTHPEVNLFPGLTAALLVVFGVGRAAFRRHPAYAAESRRRLIIRRSLGGLAGLAALAAVVFLVAGPWRLALPWVTLRMSDLNRALVLMAVCGVPFLWLTLTSREVLSRRSPLVFYAGATIAVIVFCMGPQIRRGQNVLLEPAPYQLLLQLPGFDGLRVPTRFWMLGALCLATAAGSAFARLVPPRGRIRAGATAVAALGLMLDGWMREMPMAPPPEYWPRVERRDVPVPLIELPLGPSWDAAATFRSLRHGRRVVNGVSGHDPPHYAPLQIGLNAHDPAMLLALASLGPMDVIVDASQDPGGAIERYVSGVAGIERLRTDGVRMVYRLPDVSRSDERPGVSFPVVSATASANQGRLAAALDRDLSTRWLIEPQRPGQWVEVDLGEVRRVASVVLALGRAPVDFPGRLAIDLSEDTAAWRQVWEGSTVGEAFLAAAREPRVIPMRFAFEPQPARFVRLRQLSDAGTTWTIAELSVHGAVE